MPQKNLGHGSHIVKGVNFGTTFAKWGNWNEILLNEVISVKNRKVGGKTRNLLSFFSESVNS
jgi:hypothetical protein